MTLQATDCRSLDFGRHPLASQPGATFAPAGPGSVIITSVGWWNVSGGEMGAFNAFAKRVMQNLQPFQVSVPPLTVHD